MIIRIIFFLVLMGSLMSVPAPANSIEVSPIRAAFYYPWFPETEKWKTRYSPELGSYDSSNPTVIASHIALAKYGHLDAFIASWWGSGSKTDSRLPILLSAAADHDFKISPYYEQPKMASDEELDRDFNRLISLSNSSAWLRVDGKPALFIYNTAANTCEMMSRYLDKFGRDFYLNLKVFKDYRKCPRQPSSWHQYAPARSFDEQRPYSINVAPGFYKFDEVTPRLGRDVQRFISDLERMKVSGVQWQLITSFNEWGEGTSVEPAREWRSRSGAGSYLDAMRKVF